MSNPTQWPSFSNLSVWYADVSLQKIKYLKVVVILIQRWWRSRKDGSIRLHPIVMDRWVYAVWNAKRALTADLVIDKQVCFFEKLDGTNLGIRCDGSIFGRRQAIAGDSYQKCRLDGVVPTRLQVLQTKSKIEELVSLDLPKMLLYGELMVNNKFDYLERDIFKSWLCFGVMFSPYEDGKSANLMVQALTLVDRLRSAGFYATASPDNGKIKVVMNPVLEKLLRNLDISVAPYGGSGSVKELCQLHKEEMLLNHKEGFVVTGQDILLKWKTGDEDESKGHGKLCKVLEHSGTILRHAGIDSEFAHLLKDVSGNKSTTPRISETKQVNRGKSEGPYSPEVLIAAMNSALTKYDNMEIYFARNERSIITKCIQNELVDDLKASREPEKKAVNSFVNQIVGKAYGKWKQRTPS